MKDKETSEDSNILEGEINLNENSEVRPSITCQQDLTSYFAASNNSVNKTYRSKIPQVCKDTPCQLGVDEAGRGPVLGPMVYSIAYIPLSKEQTLVDLGCADSKTLTEEKRDNIFDEICNKHDEIGWAIETISPNIISNSMYRRCKTSLNAVSMNSAIDLIKGAIESGVNVAEIYVDTVGKPEKYQAMLKSIFPEIEKIVVAKKADSTYPIVSAASICAKVSRDHALKSWNFLESNIKGECGSGYPGDPITKQWLNDNIDPIFGFPQLVRFSWSTVESILSEKAIDFEWEDIEAEAPSKNPKISMFFTKTTYNSSGEPARKKHNFFTERSLTNTVNL